MLNFSLLSVCQIDPSACKNLKNVFYTTALDEEGKPIEFMVLKIYQKRRRYYAAAHVYNGKIAHYAGSFGASQNDAIKNALVALGIKYKSDIGKLSNDSMASALRFLCEQMGLTPQVSNWI